VRARRESLAWAALVFAAALGCKPGPVNTPASLPTARALLDELRARQAQVRSLRGDSKLDFWADGGRTKVTVNLAVMRPGQLRFAAENPISGHTAGTLVTDGRRFALLDVEHNRFLVGAALPCNVARMTRIPMPPEDVVTILLGSAPIRPHEAAEVGWNPASGGREVLLLRLPGGWTQRLEMARTSRDLVDAQLHDPAGTMVWHLAHEDFRWIGGARLPKKTRFVAPKERADVVLRYRDIDVNGSIPEEVFHLTPPPGMVATEVGCAPADGVPATP
jgi:hypothetical protein